METYEVGSFELPQHCIWISYTYSTDTPVVSVNHLFAHICINARILLSGENPDRVYLRSRMDAGWNFWHAYYEARNAKEARDLYYANAEAGLWNDLEHFPEDLQWESLVDVLRRNVKVGIRFKLYGCRLNTMWLGFCAMLRGVSKLPALDGYWR